MRWVLRRGALERAEEETRRQFAGAPTGALFSAPEERPPHPLSPSRLPGRSASPVLREDIVPRLHDRMAPEPALGVVPLRRTVGGGSRREASGLGVVLERAVSPSAAIGEPLAVLHHEVDVVQRGR